MAFFLFDSSAVVKQYVAETGSAWEAGIIGAAPGHRIHIASITGVEVVSAITRRERAGSIPAADATTIRASFQADFAGFYFVIDLTLALIARAMSLAVTHALRGYDAVQLAVAVEVNTRAGAVGEAFTFISADAALLAAAVLEGLPVDNPNLHP